MVGLMNISAFVPKILLVKTVQEFFLFLNKVTSSCTLASCCPPDSGGQVSEYSTAANVTSNCDIHITHVIFDIDGTVLDTETVNDKVYGRMVESFGKEYSTDVRIRRIGNSAENTARIICELLDLPVSWEEFFNEYQTQIKEELGQSDLMPGVERLVHHLKKHKIPIALATAGKREAMEINLSKYPEFKALFQPIVTGDDPEVKTPKPAPDIFLVAASRFPEKPPPRQVLVFEDTIAGMEAAKAAKMPVVVVPDPIVPHEMLGAATIILKSLLDFQPEMFGLPPF